MFSKRLGFAVAALVFVGATATFAATRMWTGGSDAETRTEPLPASQIGQTGLRLPSFVSLKNTRVNVRRGPSRKHPIAWQYQRRGLPVEIIKEFENWRLIRDSEGEEGWVFHGLLAAKRTAVIAPWDREEIPRVLRTEPDAEAASVASAEPGALVVIESCTGHWCEIESQGYRGWMEQADLWGVYPEERLK